MSSYRVKCTDGSCHVSINGGLTAVMVPELQQALKHEVDGGAQKLTVDLGETTMVDSSGIGLLIAASNSLIQKKGDIAVVNTSPEILRLLRSMRLVSRLHVSGRPGLEQDYE
ncbi:MAG: STAS domain-containing protein [Candidatus Korobacteraceae bacterium]